MDCCQGEKEHCVMDALVSLRGMGASKDHFLAAFIVNGKAIFEVSLYRLSPHNQVNTSRINVLLGLVLWSTGSPAEPVTGGIYTGISKDSGDNFHKVRRVCILSNLSISFTFPSISAH